MPNPLLEDKTQSINYGDLPETWRVPDIESFSKEKTLYDYQEDALKKAARALYLYYGKEHKWKSGELISKNDERKQSFWRLYENTSIPSIKKYENRADKKNGEQNPVFKILAKCIPSSGEEISYQNFINRMCFWMATGSGKTLIMIKLMEYLHFLKTHREIPPHNILVLAPSEHLLRQIQSTVEEFNQSGLYIELVPLRKMHHERQTRLGDAIVVYYHRSDNISNVQKDALTDYLTYENNGKWYVFLDEAHKGGKEDSKRQAYYAVMARSGFLFNFSATFTDNEDIITTVKKYNLEEFVKNGHGKNICLNRAEYEAFKTKQEEINDRERRKIVLKSLITLAYVSLQVKKLRSETKLDLYHLPLMLTLVNSVNTEIENEKNDLWAFFQTLREIAIGKVDAELFDEARNELGKEWKNAEFFFGENEEETLGTHSASITTMNLNNLREEVFLSRNKGALQLIRSKDNRELAFQLKNAESPFALIRIGDTSKWRHELLAGYEETTTLQEKSFFDGLERSSITILMGSRSFFESWDSNRPNIINFINIGGKDAKKFVVQSIGRGVRVETLPGKRRRYAFLEADSKTLILQKYHDLVALPETLFLFATNRIAILKVLEGLEGEKQAVFEKVEGLEKAPTPKINNEHMPLLVPEYKEASNGVAKKAEFAMSEKTLTRFKEWVNNTSDSLFAVRDGLEISQVTALRGAVLGNQIQITTNKDYALIPFLQNRFLSHLSRTAKVYDKFRELNKEEDIIHFREMRVQTEYVSELKEKINQVKEGRLSDKELIEKTKKLESGKIDREEFETYFRGQDEVEFKKLKIKKLLNHYYLPAILGNEKADYIQHIIKVKSEIVFLNELEKWTKKNEITWDAWMFSKIDESLDKVYIPYYDSDKNDYRRFLPDFIFWLCKKNEYKIVFVDPKGTFPDFSRHKIKGYQKLFEVNNETHTFQHGNWKVSVNLLLYNPNLSGVSECYQKYWTNQIFDIFA